MGDPVFVQGAATLTFSDSAQTGVVTDADNNVIVPTMSATACMNYLSQNPGLNIVVTA